MEQIYFYMNREDALTVHGGVFGVYTDFTLSASRKQAELSSEIRELTIFNFPLPEKLSGGWSQTYFKLSLYVPMWDNMSLI